MKDKVRRKRVDWFKVLKKIGDPELERQYLVRRSKLYYGKLMSIRRCAYYVLKNYYHTTTIAELVEKVSDYVV